MSRAGRWLGDRLDLHRFRAKYLHKPFPVHSTFFLGEIALFAFVVLVVTGIFLAFFYEPSSAVVDVGRGRSLPAAYASVLRIDEIPIGELFRRIHHWAAHVMIAAALLHLLRVFFTGAYLKPREINWWVGLALLGVTVLAAFVGYLLPYDQFSVTATGIGYGMAISTPWVGNFLADVFFGGKFPSPGTIPRFYGYHIMLFPLLLLGLLGLHMLILLKQRHTEPAYARRWSGGVIRGVPFWPHQAVMMAILFLLCTATLSLMGAFLPVHPAEFFGPPGPSTPEVKPDWYFLWVYGALRLVPGTVGFTFLSAFIGSEAIGGILFPALVIALLILVPILDRRRESQHEVELPLQHPARLPIGVGAIVAMLVLMVAGYGDELGLSRALLRALFLALPIGTGLVVYSVTHAARRSGSTRHPPLK